MAKVLKCDDLMPGCNFVLEGKDVAELDALSFPTRPAYTGDPWFLPVVGSDYRLRDWLEVRLAA